MAKLRVTAGGEKLLSLVTFFAAAKKVTAAPHRGSANKPTRNRDPAKPQADQPKPARGKKNLQPTGDNAPNLSAVTFCKAMIRPRAA
jgi:hypothetical protein